MLFHEDGQQCLKTSVIKRAHESDFSASNSLIAFYAKYGDIIWQTIICAYAHHGCGRKTLHTFLEMKLCGIDPNDMMFVGLVCACSHAGLVSEAEDQFGSISKDLGTGLFQARNNSWWLKNDLKNWGVCCHEIDQVRTRDSQDTDPRLVSFEIHLTLLSYFPATDIYNKATLNGSSLGNRKARSLGVPPLSDDFTSQRSYSLSMWRRSSSHFTETKISKSSDN
ncbi:hypothetical protein MKW98_011693 [Papaver atlanticum]|uniref:Pentatricopeptide repeat-containing protein n=1 Tax=Papaver atlanticum TaxID=357466 RepID=A0AAD4S897_9MAGN|nr:hypothetical protein MKW98_011693 [Papaver atlanticum]